jgi:GNAT superfamily N-acetyltransferase
VAAPVPDGEGAYRIACTTAAGAAIGGVTVRPSGREALWISHLEVAPPERGRGLGVRLLDAALKLGARAGRRTACLEADDDGSGRLLRWYRGLGFALAGRSPEGRPLLSTDIHRSIRIAARRLDLAREARRAFP